LLERGIDAHQDVMRVDGHAVFQFEAHGIVVLFAHWAPPFLPYRMVTLYNRRKNNSIAFAQSPEANVPNRRNERSNAKTAG
jgi:hypothetical protein